MVRCFLSVLRLVKEEGVRKGRRKRKRKGREKKEKREERDIMAFSLLKILSYRVVFSWM